MKKYLHISFPKAWLISEKYSIISILILYILFGINKSPFNIFSNLSLLIIIISIYLQTMTFSLIKIFDDHKRGLGERWVNINTGGKIMIELNKEKILTGISYVVAIYEVIFFNNFTLFTIYAILLVKNMAMGGIYNKVIEKILIKNKKQVIA